MAEVKTVTCQYCLYTMGSAASYCGMCGWVLADNFNSEAATESRNEEGACNQVMHALALAREGYCDQCNTWCLRPDHSQFQKPSFEYCPDCGKKLSHT